jgi:DNA-3-methyladenine glycosylase II
MTMSSTPAGASRPRKTGVRAAARILAERDPVVAGLIAEFGLPSFPAPDGTPFEALVRSITYQQLAGAAARAIHGRLVARLGGEVTPERLAALDEQELRTVGMSGSKTRSLHDLAGKVLDGTVVIEPRRLGRLSDTEIVTRLSAVYGIGRWSAEMFLMFHLRRLDIWPVGDLGVRHGFAAAWDIPVPTPKQLDALGEPYHPYRSIIAWYCWRAAQRYAGSAASAVTA